MTIPDAKILETTVTPTADGVLVQLQISDAPRDAEASAIRLTLSVQMQSYRSPTLAQLERETMDLANSVFAALVEQKASEIRAGRHDLHPAL